MLGMYLMREIDPAMMAAVEEALRPFEAAAQKERLPGADALNALYTLGKQARHPAEVAAMLKFWMGGGGGSSPRACVHLVQAADWQVGHNLVALVLRPEFEERLEPLLFAVRLRVGAIHGEIRAHRDREGHLGPGWFR